MEPKSVTVIFKFSHNKHCFLTLLKSYQKKERNYVGGEDRLIVYEGYFTHNRKAYFSLYGQTPELQSGDTVQISSMYGLKVGVKEDDPVPLTLIKSTVATAKRAQVEPVSPDDWEILTMNPGRVEAVLQDQVRVIWPGQVLPVWIRPSVMIYLNIVSVEPVARCVVLGDSTELDVSSKLRTNLPPKSLSLPSYQNMGQTSSKQNQQQQQASKIQQNQRQTIASPCKSRAKELPSSSETSDYDNMDTLEPKPVTPSPRMSPRMWKKGAAAAASKKGTKNEGSEALWDSNKPMVRRQSSIMESVMRYLFRHGAEPYKPDTDSNSDSDAGSAIDYSMQNLPPRNGVLRIQPMQLSCTIEECFSIGKAEINSQIMSKHLFGIGNRSPRKSFETKIVEKKMCNVPYELFQPSTIYVDAEVTKNERLLHPYLPHLPHSFIARLQRIPSPQEKAEAATNPKKKSKDGSRGSSVGQNDGKSTNEVNDGGSDSSISGSCYVRVVVIDRRAGLTDDAWQEAADRVLSEQPLLHGHVLIPELLRRQLKLDATGSVWLQTGTVDLVIPHKVCIFPLASVPKKITNDMIILAFRNYIKRCANTEHPLVVFQGLFLSIMVFPEGCKEVSLEIQITFFGEKDLKNVKAVTMLSEMNIDSVLVTVEKDVKEDKMGVVNTMLTYSQASDIDPKPQPTKLKHLGGIENIAKQAISHLLAGLGARPLSQHTFLARAGLCQGILLITGPKGSGKTSLVKGLCRKMSHLPVLAHITFIECKSLRGKTVANIQKILESVFDEAAWREPSIIVFDNLDAIVPVPSGPENEMTGEALYSAKNSEVIQGLIKYEMENNSRLSVIATAKSRSSLHPSLVSSRGIHFIQQTLNIQSPDQDARIEILSTILQHHGSISTETVKLLDLVPIAVKTEGYVARDLESLVNRAVHTNLIVDKEAYKNKVTLKPEDFEAALCDFKPVSIRNVKLHKAGDLGWEDVGGMTDVKTTLIETLRWPAKYPQLFNSCPLRLRSGILLYGAPGTGKTLLAGAVAKECGLNFISIKGPELLSKYIGASEQAVRDLFTRAMSAKPCILFFDEFDSIAPKRGHDSTGVTDRVVNQLLTQLDGVEGLQGVYVLGATSRPDLLDPALLRPGRLDKCIACHMPDENDRHDILVALTRRMSLASDVELQEVAEICDHFTGADLKALLYNSQLKAIHEQSAVKDYEKDSVVRIKGDDAMCPAVRRASLILDECIISKLSGSLSASSSLNTSAEDKSDTTLSPRQNVDVSRNNVQTSTPRDYRQDAISPDIYMNSQRSAKKVESGDGLREKVKSQSGNQAHEDMDHDQIVEQLNLKFIDSSPMAEPGSDFGERINSPSKKDGELPPKFSEARRGSMPEIENQLLKDLQQLGDSLGAKISENPENVVYEKKIQNLKEDASSGYASVDSSHESKTRTGSHSQKTSDTQEPVVVKVTKSSTSDSESDLQHVDPCQTFPPGAGKRKRSYERTRSYGPGETGDGKSLAAPPLRSDLKSPSIDKPVTVITLKQGLATLSAEDEARYMAMVKEIQLRDLNFVEAANAKRRTSLPLGSKSSSLVEVHQHHLLEAAKTMRPSVSQQEREKYHRIYENFVSSRSEFDKQPATQVGKRATLA